MNTPDIAKEPQWENIQPVIDEAMQELNEDDRQSVLLRFFGQLPFGARSLLFIGKGQQRLG